MRSLWESCDHLYGRIGSQDCDRRPRLGDRMRSLGDRKRSLLESCDHLHEAHVLKDALYPLDRSFVLNSCYTFDTSSINLVATLQLCLPSELTKSWTTGLLAHEVVRALSLDNQ